MNSGGEREALAHVQWYVHSASVADAAAFEARNALPAGVRAQLRFLFARSDAGVERARARDLVVDGNVTFERGLVRKTGAALAHFAARCAAGDVLALADADVDLHLGGVDALLALDSVTGALLRSDAAVWAGAMRGGWVQARATAVKHHDARYGAAVSAYLRRNARWPVDVDWSTRSPFAGADDPADVNAPPPAANETSDYERLLGSNRVLPYMGGALQFLSCRAAQQVVELGLPDIKSNDMAIGVAYAQLERAFWVDLHEFSILYRFKNNCYSPQWISYHYGEQRELEQCAKQCCTLADAKASVFLSSREQPFPPNDLIRRWLWCDE